MNRLNWQFGMPIEFWKRNLTHFMRQYIGVAVHTLKPGTFKSQQSVKKAIKSAKSEKSDFFLLKMVSNALGTPRNTFKSQKICQKTHKIGKNRIRLGPLGQVRLGLKNPFFFVLFFPDFADFMFFFLQIFDF